MEHRIFFSWQSDRDERVCRELIEQALKDAIAQIGGDLSVESAIRDKLLIDRDTKELPGSPRVFEEILKKIDRAALFVADVTFCGAFDSGKLSPNPNVMLEYGWALKSRENWRIISVMNEIYGPAKPETMPFDLASFRFPIRYRLHQGAATLELCEARSELTKNFVHSLKTFFNSEQYKNSLPKAPEPNRFSARSALQGDARFRVEGAPIGQTWSRMPGSMGTPVYLADGPAMWLRLMPKFDPRQSWSTVKLGKAAESVSGKLFPLTPSDVHFLRADDGYGSYCADLSGKAGSVAFAFGTGEVWAVDTFLLDVDQRNLYAQDIIRRFAEGLKNYGVFLGTLGIMPPYTWICGLENVDGRQLIVSPQSFYGIHDQTCSSKVIAKSGEYGDQPVVETLRAFFEAMFDACGVTYDGPPRTF